MEQNRPYRLTAQYVKDLSQPGRYGDGRGGNGLSLLVKPTARGDVAKSWAQRLQLGGGKVRSIGLGAYPAVTLTAARRAAADNAARLREGRPLAAAASAPRSTGPTFAEAMEATIAVHAAAWKPGSRTEVQWRRAFDAFVLPRLGGGTRGIAEITPSDLLAVLEPIVREKPQTGKKVRGWLGMVFKWAATHGHRSDDPTAALSGALPRMAGQGGHHRAVPVAEVPAAYAAVRGASGVWPGTRLALELLVLTACRTGEVLGARWSEVDLEARIWTVPGARMKTGVEHRVPLAEPAMRVLHEARELADGSGLVFPSQSGRMLHEGALRRLGRDLKLPGSPHGFRSSFRDWCGENGVDHDVAEAALAHSRPGVVGVYYRSSLLARRAEVLQRFGTYAARGGEVIPFRVA